MRLVRSSGPRRTAQRLPRFPTARRSMSDRISHRPRLRRPSMTQARSPDRACDREHRSARASSCRVQASSGQSTFPFGGVLFNAGQARVRREDENIGVGLPVPHCQIVEGSPLPPLDHHPDHPSVGGETILNPGQADVIDVVGQLVTAYFDLQPVHGRPVAAACSIERPRVYVRPGVVVFLVSRR